MRSPSTLIGYDGNDWITHAIEGPLDLPVGRCLTRGGLIDAGANRSVGSTAWFLTTRGVYRFDGKTWSYQRTSEDNKGYGQGVKLSVSPDGTFAVAYQNQARSFWVFRQGAWSQHEVFSDGNVVDVRHLAVDNGQNIYFMEHYGRLMRLSMNADGKIIPEGANNTESTEFGSAKIAKVRAVYQDQTGSIYMAADSIEDDEEIFPGVAILHPDGRTQILRSKDLAMGWNPHYYGYPPPILTASGKQVWISNRSTGKPAALFDFGRGEFIEEVPHQRFGCFHAVADSGRLFVTQQGNLGVSRQLIMAYSPHVPGLATLDSEPREISSKPIVVSGDGAVWAIDTQERLIRFDDGEWAVVDSNTNPRTLLAGAGQVIIAEGVSSSAIYQGTKKVASGGLFELLEDHGELIRQAFGPEHSPPTTKANLMLASTRDGRLWCLHERSLRLLVGRRWHDAVDPLMKAGSRRGSLEYLAPIGDGNKVYVSDLKLLHSGGCSFFGELDGRNLRFGEAPHVRSRDEVAMRDKEGALWIHGSKGSGGSVSDYTSGQTAIRVKEEGITQQIDNSGWARLADEAGNVWLGSIWGKTPDLLRIWRAGEVLQELRIPSYEAGLLFSDRPGSVYAYTAAGLQHLTADPPDFRHYKLGRLFAVSGIVGAPRQQLYSKQGYAVVTTYVTSQHEFLLHLIRLPEEPKDRNARNSVGVDARYRRP